MSEKIQKMEWDPASLEKFNKIISKMPLFHRDIAKDVVEKQSQINAQERNASVVEEQDIVSAFYTEVPKAFYSLMVRLLDEVGFNYSAHEPKE